MRLWLPIVLVLALASVAVGQDTRNVLPPKPTAVGPPNIPDPNRQGGDTIADATVIPSIPYSNSGTTAGFTNDYDEACPYTDSTAPDVVYSYTPAGTEVVIIDLCGSGYDTKLYVYDSDLNLVACNDDAYSGGPCGVYVSALENVTLQGGTTYFIVIDGYGNAFGPYLLDVHVYVPCILECPTGGFAEGEPPLVDNYIDNWNGGCNTPPDYPCQELMGDAAGNFVLCGVSGWYLFNGQSQRDTDWFHIYAGSTGTVEFSADAEHETYFWEMFRECALGPFEPPLIAGPCAPGALTTVGPYDLGEVIWFWVGPTVFIAPPGSDDNEYDYVVWFSGLEPAVATESTSWGTVKALYQ
jgi:hypothetical protein